MISREGASGTDGSLQNSVWIILLISVAVHVPITFSEGGLRVQPSAFDILLPCIVCWGWWSGKLDIPPRRFWVPAAVAIAAIIIHSAAIGILNEPLLLGRLIKECFKLVLIIVYFVLLLMLFGRSAKGSPSPMAVLTIVSIACPIFVYFARYEPFPATRTVYAAYLAGLLFFLVLDGAWRHQLRLRLLLVVACVAAIVTSMILHSKGMAGLITATLAWIVIEPHLPKRTGPRICVIGGTVLLASIGGLLGSALMGANLEFLQHMDSLDRSIGIRAELWSVALSRLIDTFPFGIGLGQFPLSANAVPVLAHEGHRFVHNTFLGLAVELGLIGILLGSALVLLLINATRGWPGYAVPVFIVVVLPPLLIHDGHSIRILLLMTAFGLSRYLQAHQSQPRP